MTARTPTTTPSTTPASAPVQTLDIVSADGSRLVGHVQGHGPPVVLVHGALGDGDLNWDALLPHLTEHLTCITMSTRGRGPSAPGSDYSHERRVEDVLAFLAGVGGPVGLMGHSGGALLALGVAAHEDAASALSGVFVYEPPAFEVLDEVGFARLGETIARIGAAAAEDRLTDGAQILIEDIAQANTEELADADLPRWAETWAETVPVFLEEVAHLGHGQSATDPTRLGRITAPTHVAYGAETGPRFAASATHVIEYLADPHPVVLAGVGHLAPQLAPASVAGPMIRAFSQGPT